MAHSRIKLLFIAALVIGGFFRLSGLGNKMYSHDEAYTSLRAAGFTGAAIIDDIWDGQEKTADDIQKFLRPDAGKNVLSTLDGLARSEPQTAPLYFVLSHYWMRLVGHAPADMRLLAALLSLFAIPGMYWLGIELFNTRRTALLAAALISLSPFHLLFAQDARAYGLFAVVTILSSAALLYALRGNRKRQWFLYGLFLIFGVYTHHLFVLVLAAHGAFLILFRSSLQKGQLLRFVIVSFISLIAYTPWLFQIMPHLDSVKRGLNWAGASMYGWRYIQGWMQIFASPFIDLHLGTRSVIPYILRVPALLLLGFASVFLVISLPRRVWAFLLLLIGFTTLPLFLSDFLSGGSISIAGRYFVGLSVATIPIVAHLLSEKLNVPKLSLAKLWVVVAVLVFSSQLVSGINILVLKTWWNKNLSSNSPQIVELLNQSSHPLLIFYDQNPTDFGDILALSLMVDEDVRFKLAYSDASVDISGTYSNVYIFNRSETNYIRPRQETRYQTQEVVSGRLWEIILPQALGSPE
jgi:uncharacterized membrane protein